VRHLEDRQVFVHHCFEERRGPVFLFGQCVERITKRPQELLRDEFKLSPGPQFVNDSGVADLRMLVHVDVVATHRNHRRTAERRFGDVRDRPNFLFILQIGDRRGEIREEAGWEVTAGPLLDCWQYHIREGADVVIVTYGCHVLSTDPPLVSNEHKQAGLFAMSEIPDLVMPDGYKRSIAAWSARLGGKDAMSGPEAHVPASGSSNPGAETQTIAAIDPALKLVRPT
jgi:hypothetical protein